MANVTEKIKSIDKRVSALENTTLDDSSSVARIVKNYDNVRVKMTVKVNVHQYHVCSETLFCSDDLYI